MIPRSKLADPPCGELDNLDTWKVGTVVHAPPDIVILPHATTESVLTLPMLSPRIIIIVQRQ